MEEERKAVITIHEDGNILIERFPEDEKTGESFSAYLGMKGFEAIRRELAETMLNYGEGEDYDR